MNDELNQKPTQLRHGSDMAKARSIILKAGKPLYIMDLLEAMGKERTNKNKLSVAGSISTYVRKNQFFTRPAPNTFGVVEFEQENKNEQAVEDESMNMYE